MSKPVILTGIRSNDEPTLGNYLGAFLPMIRLAKEKAGEYQINMFVPDLHSFTTPVDYGQLYQNSLRNIGLFVAAGLPIDHPDVFVYRQSYIPAHSELAWILSCFTGFGEASRMLEFKDKSSRLGESQVSVGLFNYPLLMAADILLYGAEWIPVGEDQRQHLELTRDIAQRMNSKFGDLFRVPHDTAKQQALTDQEAAPRIRSLRNPAKKMSKSVEDPAGTILLSDDPNEAAQKIVSSTTDSVGKINFDWDKQPGITNLLQISALLAARPLRDVADEWTGKTSYGDLKSHVAEQVRSMLTDLQAQFGAVNEQKLSGKLQTDEAAMQQIANATLLRAQQAVGVRPR